jgi:hypothetical protein
MIATPAAGAANDISSSSQSRSQHRNVWRPVRLLQRVHLDAVLTELELRPSALPFCEGLMSDDGLLSEWWKSDLQALM